jgi:transposase
MFERRSWVSELRELIGPIVQVLEQIDIDIARAEVRLQRAVEQDPKIQLLMTVPNVSAVTAAVFVSVIDDAHRFGNAHQVGAYLGLVPSERSSGDHRRIGAITKQGNSYARATLMHASWGQLRLGRSADPLQQWPRRLHTDVANSSPQSRWRDVWRERQAQETQVRAAATRQVAQKARKRLRPHARKLEQLTEMNL